MSKCYPADDVLAVAVKNIAVPGGHRNVQSIPHEKQRSSKIHALTSLRFFAALYVVIFHALVIPSFLTGISQDGPLGRFLGLGYVSVSFFFLLSGYILGVVYLRHESQVSLKTFYWARFARVYPLFFLTLVLDTPNLFLIKLAVYGLTGGLLRTAIRFAANVVMLQAWIPAWRGIDNPNWSLSVETIFYLVFPFLGVALWKLRGLRLWILGVAIFVCGQVLVFLVAPRINFESAMFLPLLHLSTFAIGILLARWQTLRMHQRVEGRGSKRLIRSLFLALAVVSFAAVVYFSTTAMKTNLFDGLLAPIFVIVIWSFSDSDWLPARLLSVRWLVVLGESSFALYLIHFPVLHLFQHLGWHHIVALFPVYLGVNIGLSVLSFYYFEAPMRRWIIRRSGVVRAKETLEMASNAQ